MADRFEKTIHNSLHQYLLGINEIDSMLPDCPDVMEKWEAIGSSYIPDGAREFRNYPVASLGWMMYIGMAVAKLWDDEWNIYSQIEDLYLYMRNKRGYDAMDEYIREDVLMLQGKTSNDTEALVNECATRVHYDLLRENIEPGTKEAFDAYVTCLRQLYLFGAAVQLHRIGYHMGKLQ